MDALEASRVCTRCSVEKDINCFSKSKMHRNGIRPECRQCRNARARDYYKTPEGKKKVQKYAKKYNEANPLVWKQRYLLRTYNITIQEYDELLKKQGGVCAICGRPEEIRNPTARDRSSLAVDHCHETGKVRGLLCFKCNTGIGALGDDIEALERAISYLKGDILYEQSEIDGWMK